MTVDIRKKEMSLKICSKDSAFIIIDLYILYKCNFSFNFEIKSLCDTLNDI